MADPRQFGPDRFVDFVGFRATAVRAAHGPASPAEKNPSDNPALRTENRRSRLAA